MKKFSQRNPSSRGYSPRSTSAGRRVASLRYLPSGVFLQLEAPYNKAFTDTMKASLPSKKRIWDNQDKAWYIVKDQMDKLCYLLDQHFDETILLDFPTQEITTTAWNTLFLIEGAPLEVIRASYKALALKHHPDKGGDVSLMSTINTAYKELLGEFTNGKETKDGKV